MHKRILVTIGLLLTLAVSGLANDALVLSMGDTIHPVTETVIQIERENLVISYNETTRLWDVEVDFIFYNPTDQPRKEQVAFVNYAVPYEDFNHRITGFTTRVNGVTLPFTRREESGKHPDLPWEGSTEYFISTITFQPGYTRVNHKYSYSGIIGTYYGFSYVLTTAKKWKGPIKYFSLTIELPENSSVGKPELALVPYGQFKKDRYDRCFFRRGGFFFTATDFVPETDLWVKILVLPYYLYSEYPLAGREISMHTLLYDELNPTELADLTKEELRILRNAIYAWHGYKFADPELTAYFLRQSWYFPEDDNAKIRLTELQSKNVELLLAYEGR